MRKGNFYIPRSAPPAREIEVMKLGGLRQDEKVLLLSLQGLVNRREPSLYAVDELGGGDPEFRWLEYLTTKGYRYRIVDDPYKLLDEYRWAMKGGVIYDPALTGSFYAAATLAGLEDAVLLSPELAKRLSLRILEDFHGRWKWDADAMEWAIQNLWPRTSRDVLYFYLYGIDPPEKGFSPTVPALDYLIAFRAFFLFAKASVFGKPPFVGLREREKEIVEKVLSEYPPNRLVLGTCIEGFNEHLSIYYASYYGNFTTYVYHHNLSFHSGYRPEGKFRHRPIEFRDLEDKVYLCFAFSDGDNLYAVERRGTQWADPKRGLVPLAWSQTPAALDLMPDAMEYFYSTATPNDYNIAGCSGIGYVDPEFYGRYYGEKRGEIFDEYLRITAAYMEKMDMREIWPLKDDLQIDRRHAQVIPNLNGIFSDYLTAESYENSIQQVEGVPVFRPLVDPWARGDDIAGEGFKDPNYIIGEIRAKTPKVRPAFMFIGLNNWTIMPSQVVDMIEALGSEYVVVRPDEFIHLYLESK